MYTCIYHIPTHLHMSLYLNTHLHTYTLTYLNMQYTHIYTLTMPHMHSCTCLVHTHTIPRHNDAYTFHFSPNTTCLCWCCFFYPKFLSLSSPPTETLPILSRSSPNNTSSMESTSPAGTHFYIFCASRIFSFSPEFSHLFIHELNTHVSETPCGPGTAGGPGATAVNSPGLVPILRASSLLEGRSQSSMGIKWVHCGAGHTRRMLLKQSFLLRKGAKRWFQ